MGFFGGDLGKRRLRLERAHPRRQHLPRAIIDAAAPLRVA
jgi:hypothetical protein